MLELLQSKSVREHTEKALDHVVERERRKAFAHYSNAQLNAEDKLLRILRKHEVINLEISEIKQRVSLQYIKGDPLYFAVFVDGVSVGEINMHDTDMGEEPKLGENISKETELEQKLVKIKGN